MGFHSAKAPTNPISPFFRRNPLVTLLSGLLSSSPHYLVVSGRTGSRRPALYLAHDHQRIVEPLATTNPVKQHRMGAAAHANRPRPLQSLSEQS